jgi:hypothetical protein
MTEKSIQAPPPRIIDLLLKAEGWKSGVRHPYELKDANGDVFGTLYFPVRSRAVTIELHQYITGCDPKHDSDRGIYWLIKTAQLEDGSPAFQLGDFADLRAQLSDNLLGELELFAINPHPLPKKELPEQLEDEKKDSDKTS